MHDWSLLLSFFSSFHMYYHLEQHLSVAEFVTSILDALVTITVEAIHLEKANSYLLRIGRIRIIQIKSARYFYDNSVKYHIDA